MAMFLSTITDRGAAPALLHTMTFNEQRLRVIADNIANTGTQGYRGRHLDKAAFQSALREALDRRGGRYHKPFIVKGGQVRTRADGGLRVEPEEYPVENILFHDRTNISMVSH